METRPASPNRISEELWPPFSERPTMHSELLGTLPRITMALAGIAFPEGTAPKCRLLLMQPACMVDDSQCREMKIHSNGPVVTSGV